MPTPRGTGGPPPTDFDYSAYTTTESMEASHAIKDGAGGKSIFIPELIKDVNRYKPSLGQKVMDIIMYPAGANHPLVVAGRIPQGRPVHITWVYVHKGLGLNNDWFICLARTYGQRCPACEKRAAIMGNPGLTDDQVKQATAPYNTGKYPLGIYNCIFHSNPQNITWSEPVMVWDINNSFMESELQSKAKSPMGEGYINYGWPTAGEQGGRHISFEITQKGQFFDYKGHEFHVRKSPVPPHVMAQAVCLDDLLYVPTYEEVKEAVDMGLNEPIGGEGIGAPSGVSLPGSYQPFGTPGPQVPFAECNPLGSNFEGFEECATCTVRIDCQKAAAPPEAASAPDPIPASNPAPAPAPARAPIPRRPTR